MKSRSIVGAGVLTLVFAHLLGVCQLNNVTNAQAKESVYEAKSRIRSAINYSRVAALKVASRKSTYRMGEMIAIDVALLNITDSPVFFHKLELPSVELRAHDERGVDVGVVPITTILEGITNESYRLTAPHKTLVNSFLIVARCGDKDRVAYDQALHKLNEDEREGRVEYQRCLFERNLFVNWGDGCLDVSQPGRYFITAELSNDHVMVSQSAPRTKTAVGIIKSAELIITVTE